ncbi:CPBP family intramembrane glutamic endopeptidase [Crossiella cryophila]|uniref:Membrane protease YdiL (CAAX protease family) n=1 Tax=Crossiella cryophila TaxID=43355 RepID=A0A7W7CJE4_9PSEU|nr:CPBP family intramembrane glutamic endopeptidase [Crossiella cryophila]MBB4682052.1 membrane protease YdiL (CAAX protease family) [Crossiella cryophila]
MTGAPDHADAPTPPTGFTRPAPPGSPAPPPGEPTAAAASPGQPPPTWPTAPQAEAPAAAAPAAAPHLSAPAALPPSVPAAAPPAGAAAQPHGLGQPPATFPVADIPGYGPAPAAPPSWSTYSAPMRDVDQNRDPYLHPTYYEAQQVAATRTSVHWGILVFVLGYGAFHLAGLIINAVMAGQFRGFDPAEPPVLGPLLLLSFAPNLLLGLVPAIASWWKGSGLRRDFGIVPTLRDLRVGLVCGAISIGAAFLINPIVFGLGGGSPPPATGIFAGNEGRTVWLALLALFLFIGAPLTEELLTRGALWGALEQYRVPRYAILVLTALVFSLMHQEPDRTLALFAQGVAMGWARMLTGRIGASIVAHAVNNLLPALIFFFGANLVPS